MKNKGNSFLLKVDESHNLIIMKHKEFYETIHENDKLSNFGNDFRVY